MTRYLLIFLLLLPACSESEAWMSPVMLGGGVPCPSGTYDFFWNGDHTSGEGYACITNGTGTQNTAGSDGTDRINVTAGQSGNGFQISAANQYVYWTVTGEDILDDTICTIWMSVKPENADFANQAGLWESNVDVNNKALGFIRPSDDSYNIFTKGNGTEEGYFGISDDITNGAWQRVGFSWTTATAKVAVWDAAGWSESVSTTHTAWASAMDDFSLGEYVTGVSHGYDIYIDSVYIITGSYQAADPGAYP